MLPRHARCVLSRLRCNGQSLLLSSFFFRIGRVENLSCSACRHSSQITSRLILQCPATDFLGCSFFGDSLSLYDLWYRPWGVVVILGLHGLPPCLHLSEGVGNSNNSMTIIRKRSLLEMVVRRKTMQGLFRAIKWSHTPQPHRLHLPRTIPMARKTAKTTGAHDKNALDWRIHSYLLNCFWCGFYFLTSLAWVTLPGAHTSASTALRINETHKLSKAARWYSLNEESLSRLYSVVQRSFNCSYFHFKQNLLLRWSPKNSACVT